MAQNYQTIGDSQIGETQDITEQAALGYSQNETQRNQDQSQGGIQGYTKKQVFNRQEPELRPPQNDQDKYCCFFFEIKCGMQTVAVIYILSFILLCISFLQYIFQPMRDGKVGTFVTIAIILMTPYFYTLYIMIKWLRYDGPENRVKL